MVFFMYVTCLDYNTCISTNILDNTNPRLALVSKLRKRGPLPESVAISTILPIYLEWIVMLEAIVCNTNIDGIDYNHACVTNHAGILGWARGFSEEQAYIFEQCWNNISHPALKLAELSQHLRYGGYSLEQSSEVIIDTFSDLKGGSLCSPFFQQLGTAIRKRPILAKHLSCVPLDDINWRRFVLKALYHPGLPYFISSIMSCIYSYANLSPDLSTTIATNLSQCLTAAATTLPTLPSDNLLSNMSGQDNTLPILSQLSSGIPSFIPNDTTNQSPGMSITEHNNDNINNSMNISTNNMEISSDLGTLNSNKDRNSNNEIIRDLESEQSPVIIGTSGPITNSLSGLPPLPPIHSLSSLSTSFIPPNSNSLSKTNPSIIGATDLSITNTLACSNSNLPTTSSVPNTKNNVNLSNRNSQNVNNTNNQLLEPKRRLMTMYDVKTIDFTLNKVMTEFPFGLFVEGIELCHGSAPAISSELDGIPITEEFNRYWGPLYYHKRNVYRVHAQRKWDDRMKQSVFGIQNSVSIAKYQSLSERSMVTNLIINSYFFSVHLFSNIYSIHLPAPSFMLGTSWNNIISNTASSFNRYCNLTMELMDTIFTPEDYEYVRSYYDCKISTEYLAKKRTRTRRNKVITKTKMQGKGKGKKGKKQVTSGADTVDDLGDNLRDIAEGDNSGNKHTNDNQVQTEKGTDKINISERFPNYGINHIKGKEIKNIGRGNWSIEDRYNNGQNNCIMYVMCWLVIADLM